MKTHKQHEGKWTFTAGLVVLVMLLGLAGVSTWRTVNKPAPDTIVLGVNTPFPPFEMRMGNEVVGFDIDIARHIAEATGRDLVIMDFNEFDTLLPALQNETVDIVISAVTIREDRAEVVDFSDPYFSASQAVLTLEDSGVVFSGDPQDLEGLSIGYQEGTTSQFWIEDEVLGEVDIEDVTSFGDISMGLQLLRLNSVDAIVIDEPAATSFANTYGDLSVAGTIDTGEEYGVAVAKDDPQGLIPVINNVLKELKESGEYDELILEWFGGDAS